MNRHAIKTWSITFPRSGDVGREEFAGMFPPADEVICSREEHKDGGYHLHLAIRLKKGITKVKLLRWISVKFPEDYKRIDVQATRSMRCWEDYITKEDSEAYRFIDESVKSKIRKKIEEKIEALRPKEDSSCCSRLFGKCESENFKSNMCKGCVSVCVMCLPLWEKYWNKLNI